MSNTREPAATGLKTAPRFSMLRPALKEWAAIVNRYALRHKEPPYFYSSYERVNCGLLAAAMWRTNIVALHEIAVDRKRMKGDGRADLKFWLGDKEYYIEAKMCWPTLAARSNADSIGQDISHRLDQAVHDSRKYILGPADRWIATLFVVPHVPTVLWRRPDLPSKVLREFVSGVKSEALKADFAAWALPHGSKRWAGCSYGDYHYPAVAVVGKLVPHR
jgi:hypothetical protein